MATKTPKTETAATSAFDGIKSAFAPITEAMQTMQSKIEVPQAAREFVLKAAGNAQERAEQVNAGVAKATATVETAAVSVVTEMASVSRNIQSAMHEDVAAYFAHIGKLASAKCASEAMQIQADYFRGRGEAAVSRTKATSAYVGGMLSNGVKSVQANMASFGKSAA